MGSVFALPNISLVKKKGNEIHEMRKLLLFMFFTLPMLLYSQTIEQVERELHRQQVPQAKIVLAQARLETGNFTSKMCREKHNLFGIKHNGRYAKYARWQDSIADYKKCISSRYKGGDYYSYLKSIGYASDSRYVHKLKNIVKTSK